MTKWGSTREKKDLKTFGATVPLEYNIRNAYLTLFEQLLSNKQIFGKA